jgi:hypothetical protein
MKYLLLFLLSALAVDPPTLPALLERALRGLPGLSRLSRAFRRMVVVSVLVGLFGPLLHAQEIHIRVLNAHNGKPITNECVNVSLGPWHGADLLAATNKDGVAVLRMADNEVLAETAYPGWPAQASGRSDVDAITISGDHYVACQEYRKITPGERPTDSLNTMPSYPVKRILEFGISAANTCGKFRAEAKPGELIFFVRPRTWLEKLKL